jgi:hypothetical protein
VIEQESYIIGFRGCSAVETLVKKVECRPNPCSLVHGISSTGTVHTASVNRGDVVSEMAELQGNVITIVAAACTTCIHRTTTMRELALTCNCRLTFRLVAAHLLLLVGSGRA